MDGLCFVLKILGLTDCMCTVKKSSGSCLTIRFKLVEKSHYQPIACSILHSYINNSVILQCFSMLFLKMRFKGLTRVI